MHVEINLAVEFYRIEKSVYGKYPSLNVCDFTNTLENPITIRESYQPQDFRDNPRHLLRESWRASETAEGLLGGSGHLQITPIYLFLYLNTFYFWAIRLSCCCLFPLKEFIIKVLSSKMQVSDHCSSSRKMLHGTSDLTEFFFSFFCSYQLHL